jgi:hypothetical protein
MREYAAKEMLLQFGSSPAHDGFYSIAKSIVNAKAKAKAKRRQYSCTASEAGKVHG